jgi:hypothetical protein
MRTTREPGRWSALSAALLLLSFSGCSGNKPIEPSASGATAAKAPAPAAIARPALKRPAAFDKISAPKDAGVIIGRVIYQGTPPKPKPINFGPEKVCADLSRENPAVYETLVVNPDSTVKWAFVSIRGNVPGKHSPPATPVVIDQRNCIFVPHVAAVMSGQEIEYRNSDPVSHNIRSNARRNPAFNSIFAAKASSKSKLELPEQAIQLKCDIHFWMSAYLHVVQHPFFAVTGDDGSFVITGVPPGNYTLAAWHESLKPQPQNISLSAGEVKEVDFIVSGE